MHAFLVTALVLHCYSSNFFVRMFIILNELNCLHAFLVIALVLHRISNLGEEVSEMVRRGNELNLELEYEREEQTDTHQQFLFLEQQKYAVEKINKELRECLVRSIVYLQL